VLALADAARHRQSTELAEAASDLQEDLERALAFHAAYLSLTA
jgi:hypothetical protein